MAGNSRGIGSPLVAGLSREWGLRVSCDLRGFIIRSLRTGFDIFKLIEEEFYILGNRARANTNRGFVRFAETELNIRG